MMMSLFEIMKTAVIWMMLLFTCSSHAEVEWVEPVIYVKANENSVKNIEKELNEKRIQKFLKEALNIKENLQLSVKYSSKDKLVRVFCANDIDNVFKDDFYEKFDKSRSFVIEYVKGRCLGFSKGMEYSRMLSSEGSDKDKGGTLSFLSEKTKIPLSSFRKIKGRRDFFDSCYLVRDGEVARVYRVYENKSIYMYLMDSRVFSDELVTRDFFRKIEDLGGWPLSLLDEEKLDDHMKSQYYNWFRMRCDIYYNGNPIIK